MLDLADKGFKSYFKYVQRFKEKYDLKITGKGLP